MFFKQNIMYFWAQNPYLYGKTLVLLFMEYFIFQKICILHIYQETLIVWKTVNPRQVLGLHIVQFICENVHILIYPKHKQAQYVPVPSSVPEGGVLPKWKNITSFRKLARLYCTILVLPPELYHILEKSAFFTYVNTL